MNLILFYYDTFVDHSFHYAYHHLEGYCSIFAEKLGQLPRLVILKLSQSADQVYSAHR